MGILTRKMNPMTIRNHSFPLLQHLLFSLLALGFAIGSLEAQAPIDGIWELDTEIEDKGMLAKSRFTERIVLLAVGQSVKVRTEQGEEIVSANPIRKFEGLKAKFEPEEGLGTKCKLKLRNDGLLVGKIIIDGVRFRVSYFLLFCCNGKHKDGNEDRHCGGEDDQSQFAEDFGCLIWEAARLSSR